VTHCRNCMQPPPQTSHSLRRGTPAPEAPTVPQLHAFGAALTPSILGLGTAWWLKPPHTVKILAMSLRKISEIHATRWLLWNLDFMKFNFGRGSAPDPDWGSLRRSPRPSSRMGRGIPPPHYIRPRRLRHIVLDASGTEPIWTPPAVESWRRAWL